MRWLKTMPTGSERKAVPSVPQFEHLDRLKIYIEHRQTTTNLLSLSPSSGQSADDDVEMAVTDDLSDRSITSFPLSTDESGCTVTDIDTGENDSNNEECSQKIISDENRWEERNVCQVRKTMII